MPEPSAEQQRLLEDKQFLRPWRRWGPYLSERQWGTVREDYSPDGSAWNYLPHDHARSRAYRWGEDGIAGISDDSQLICFSIALWNGKDPILKERLFGLTGPEGNHGEDVKEVYYYLDAAPTASYLKMLYKYPQAPFPYGRLVEENHRRGKKDDEFELLDTGIFDDDRYFDVFVEYAKAGPDDILIRITVANRGPDSATLQLLPQIWFRNTWSWKNDHRKPILRAGGPNTIELRHERLGIYTLRFDSATRALFCENETNIRRLYGSNAEGYFKDGINDAIVSANATAVNPAHVGTKGAVHYALEIPAGGEQVVRLRLSSGTEIAPIDETFDALFATRIVEADDFYARLQTGIATADARMVQRQAFAGMVWSKQYYSYDVREWLEGDPAQPEPPAQRKRARNCDWQHLNNGDIISMPDKWEYPWYAAWDLAFHCIPLAMIDPDFAKEQLILLTREWYMHPNGQLPAYEWAFGDVNPPVHAWATWRVYQMEKESNNGKGDIPFLERVFHKLLLNFTWWVNRKDRDGRNIFQGGFLGLDNIGVFDRSAILPTGGHINQADATSWMAMYCLNLMRISVELARFNTVYQDTATKFFEHFLYIAAAMAHIGDTMDDSGGVNLWDERDEFFYDVLSTDDGHTSTLGVRSMVGLIPLYAVEVLASDLLNEVPEFAGRLEWFLNYRPDLANLVSRWHESGKGETRLLSLLRGHRMKCLLRRMLDETEFLSPHGVRALSKYHQAHPYVFRTEDETFSVTYEPAESRSGLFGGNSNWRGPIWMPVNYLIIESLRKFHLYYGDDFKVECPTGSGQYLTISQVADELSVRLTRLFLKDESGVRPVLGYHPKLQTDPHFRDYVLFHEYFHGDTGRGVGASHQTGWTGLVAVLLDPTFRMVRPPSGMPDPAPLTTGQPALRPLSNEPAPAERAPHPSK